MAIVLPNSDLNNISLEYVRQWIKSQARVLAVVSLPVGTFMSAGSNPQPSILFVKKYKDDAERNAAGSYPIYMAAIERIGFDLNTKTAPVLYKRDPDGELVRDKSGKVMVDSDMPEAIEGFQSFLKNNKISLH